MLRSFRPGRALIALFVVLLALLSLPAYAAGGGSRPRRARALQKQIDQLQRDLKRLERANTAIEPMVDEKINKQWVTAGFNMKDGFFIQDPTKEYRLRIGGYTQLDRAILRRRLAGEEHGPVPVPPRPSDPRGIADEVHRLQDHAGLRRQQRPALRCLRRHQAIRRVSRLGEARRQVQRRRSASSACSRRPPFRSSSAPRRPTSMPTRDVGIQVWGSPWAGTILLRARRLRRRARPRQHQRQSRETTSPSPAACSRSRSRRGPQREATCRRCGASASAWPAPGATSRATSPAPISRVSELRTGDDLPVRERRRCGQHRGLERYAEPHQSARVTTTGDPSARRPSTSGRARRCSSGMSTRTSRTRPGSSRRDGSSPVKTPVTEA